MDYDNFYQILKLRINFTSFAILRGYFANFTSFSNQYNICACDQKWLYFFFFFVFCFDISIFLILKEVIIMKIHKGWTKFSLQVVFF